MDTRKHITAYISIVTGILTAPLLPFFALLIFPVLAVMLNAPVAALLFTVLVDSFLLPSGAPLFHALTPYIILFLPVHAYIKHISTV